MVCFLMLSIFAGWGEGTSRDEVIEVNAKIMKRVRSQRRWAQQERRWQRQELKHHVGLRRVGPGLVAAISHLTLIETGVGAVLLVTARCFSRWLSAGGKASAYRHPPSSLQQTKNVSRWLAHLSREPAVVRPPSPSAPPEAAVGPVLLRRCPLPPWRVGLCQPRVARWAEAWL